MPSPDLVEALDLLTHGELTIEGRLVDASNLTLRCRVRWEGQEARCVYKPVEGERPLWDFPDHTLARREVAAYLVSEATGWALVPPTVLRDGPLGVGSCQLWIDPADREPLVGFIPDDQLPADWMNCRLSRCGSNAVFVTCRLTFPVCASARYRSMLNRSRLEKNIIWLPSGLREGVRLYWPTSSPRTPTSFGP